MFCFVCLCQQERFTEFTAQCPPRRARRILLVSSHLIDTYLRSATQHSLVAVLSTVGALTRATQLQLVRDMLAESIMTIMSIKIQKYGLDGKYIYVYTFVYIHMYVFFKYKLQEKYIHNFKIKNRHLTKICKLLKFLFFNRQKFQVQKFFCVIMT